MNGTSKRILYTGAFRFPTGDAAAARVLGIGRVFRALGYVVEYFGWEASPRAADLKSDGTFAFEDFRYESLDEFRRIKLGPVRRLLRYFSAGTNTLQRLSREDVSSVKAIICYNGGSIFLMRLARFCKANNLPLILDCTEWYDGRALPGGRFGLAHIDSEFRMRVVNKSVKHMIAISEYLSTYYATCVDNLVVIPPLFDPSSSRWGPIRYTDETKDPTLRLVYAGVPGKKDLLAPVLEAVLRLRALGYRTIVTLVGPDRSELSHLVGEPLALASDDVVVCLGRVQQEDVPHYIRAADFSVILRPIAQYSQAGFPTKLMESFACGVPVIASAVGDIAKYVVDGRNGILVSDVDGESVFSGLLRAHRLTQQQRKKLRRDARSTAEEAFSHAVYIPQMREFVGRLEA